MTQDYSLEEIRRILQKGDELSPEFVELEEKSARDLELQERIRKVQIEMEDLLPHLPGPGKIWLEEPLQERTRRKEGFQKRKKIPRRILRLLPVAAGLVLVLALVLYQFVPELLPREKKATLFKGHGLNQCGDNFSYMSGSYKASNSLNLPASLQESFEFIRTFSMACQCGKVQYKVKEYRHKKTGKIFVLLPGSTLERKHPR